MAEGSGIRCQIKSGAVRAAVVATTALLMGGCAGLSELPSMMADNSAAATETGTTPQSDLQKATEYWGKRYAENPAELEPALNYARNLRALGEKQQALNILQQASMLHATDRQLNSEYGRLALELDQVSIADRLLAAADDPAKPDWRVVSARGTVLSKQQRYAEAIRYYERASQLSANQPSVMNNLALAYAMNGEPARAEEVLRRIPADGPANVKVRQNLALVLGLQGKYDEATKVGAEVASKETAKSNTNVIKQMVRLDAKPYKPAKLKPSAWEAVVTGPAENAAWKPNAAKSPAAAATPVAAAPAATAAPVTTASAAPSTR